ncbi:MAG TPA: hypothetical protein VMI53_07790 [Opitutaceae bacterium]|nr:hypothetical protein [Opitutaceae bacterium]
MFSRLILHHRDAAIGIIAFAVALSIFLMMVWRALRMPHAQREALARLPFQPDLPSRRHDDAKTTST